MIKSGDVAEIRHLDKDRIFWSYVKDWEGSIIKIYEPNNSRYTPISLNDTVEINIKSDDGNIIKGIFKVVKISDSEKKYFEALPVRDIEVIENKRELLRVSARLDVKLFKTTDGLNKSKEYYKFITKEISPGGCSGELEGADISEGDMVYLEIEINGKSAYSKALVKEKKSGEKKAETVSFVFIDIDEFSEALITKLIYSYQRVFGLIERGG
ncbi:MAG: PilZ domain-containing protein [Elusimicrobiales bacterium]|nr:PilZ domain-containing protein [Elusimicrobiales bacterium]